ncbi:hypothetical protein D3C73_1209470 [compost metagenome]
MHVLPIGAIRVNLHFAPPFLNPVKDSRQTAFQINQHMRMGEIRRHYHSFIQLCVCSIIRSRHRALIRMHFGKNARIFIDGAVLHKAAA